MNPDRYLEMFMEDTEENLRSLKEGVLRLSDNPEDSAVADELFRIAHTVKGTSSSMGFFKIAGLLHEMENVLYLLKNDKIRTDRQITGLLSECVEVLDAHLRSIAETGTEGAINDNTLRGMLKAAASGIAAGSALCSGLNAYDVRIVLRKDCVFKYARAYLILQTLNKCGEVINSNPAPEDIEKENFGFEFRVDILTRETTEKIRRDLEAISEIESIDVLPAKSIGDKGRAERTDDKLPREIREMASAIERGDIDRGSKTVRLGINQLEKLEALVDKLYYIQELMRQSNGIFGARSRSRILGEMGLTVDEIKNTILKMRHVPVEMIFRNLTRIVRNTSPETGKEIRLLTLDNGVEVDRTIIDDLGEVLVHLLKNAVDHGIERKAERSACGKNPVGNIRVSASRVENEIVIEVEDDGCGVDLEKVKKKAIETGLVDREAVNNLSEKDIMEFVFKAGLTTSKGVTDVSGRGIGLDIVKSKINLLRGTVEVRTERGKGTVFTIRIPFLANNLKVKQN